MKVNRRYTVPFRRKREQKTNYHRRLRLLRSKALRVVVRKTANHHIAQLVRFEPKGDIVLAQADSRELKGFKWGFRGNLPSAYLTGYLLAKRSQKVKMDKDPILDLGSNVPQAGSRVYAMLKGCVEGGLAVRHSEEVLPSDERVSGAHIAAYASQAKGHQFAKVSKQADPKNIVSIFEQAKQAIEQVK